MSHSLADEKVVKLVRYAYQKNIQYGQVLGKQIYPIRGNIYETWQRTERSIPLSQVTILTPTEAKQVFAVGMNFASHLASDSDSPPPLFLKLPTSLIASKRDIRLPADAENVHYEGEMVIVIGQRIRNANLTQAKQAILGVTMGNDLTERNWQGDDLQWIRAKASEGFGPVGPYIALGLDYNQLQLTTRLNGQIVQQENTRHMIHKPSKVISFLSRYFTLMPGDLIFMGTPGQTRALSQGDMISVELEKVGILVNRVVQ